MKFKYSFIVPTFNRPNDIEDLLKDLGGLISESKFEVIVFNDSRNKHTELLLKTRYKYSVKYLFSNNKINSSVARNECIKQATGEWLIFLDDDVRLQSDFLQQVEKYSKDYLAFSFKMDLPNKQTKTLFINKILEILYPGKILPFFGHFVGGFDRTYVNNRSVDHLPGANMIFKRSVVKDIRFDNFIGQGTGYLDDANFSYSVKKHNKIKLWYISTHKITHLQTPAGGYRQLDRNKWFYYYQNHKFYFFKKHFSEAYKPLIIFFNLIEALVRSISYKTNLIPIFLKAYKDV